MEAIIQCISAFMACLGFAFVFRIHYHFQFAILGSLVGMIGWIVYLATSVLHSMVLQSFLATIVITVLAELIARIKKAPATIFLLTGCFPLVPGKGIYESMLYAVQGDSSACITSLLHTFSISISIALAILIISTIFKIIKKYNTRRTI